MRISDFTTIDFETYYDKDYSLSKLQTDAYIKDDRFEIIGVGVKANKASEPEWITGSHLEIAEYLNAVIREQRLPVCCHHTHFDGFIITQRLGIKPVMWLDTLSMLRMHYPWWRRYGLAFAAEELGLGRKGHQVANYKGYTLQDFEPWELKDYGNYCKNDVALTHTMATLLLDKTPLLELALIDMTIRMFTEPRIAGDRARLIEYHKSEVRRKEELLEKANVDKSIIMSNNKFADALRELGVEPPVKQSRTTGKMTYAFAKTDKNFTALLDHENEDVQALVAARMGVKSTIAETRAMRLVEMAGRGRMPVYLQHWGAKTTGRLSGGDKMNWQNVPARGPAAEIRQCLVAPPGHVVVVGDSSNIELRVVMVASGQQDAVQKIRDGVDLYCDFAGKIYGRDITKEDETERFLGKVAMLSLQYGSGAETFREMVRVMSKGKITISLAEAQHIVSLYRYMHGKVETLWRYCGHDVLQFIQQRNVLQSVDVNGWALTNTTGFSLPGSPGVCYHNLKQGRDGWTYEAGGSEVKIYGGKVVENLCQHLARQIVMWQTARIHRRYPVALSVHDEAVCVVPEEQAEECAAYMHESLALAPVWCRGQIPLKGEVGIGDSYGEAK